MQYYRGDTGSRSLKVRCPESHRNTACKREHGVGRAMNLLALSQELATDTTLRFLLNAIVDTDPRASLAVVVNWTANVKW
jgi:hypothetical protein